MDNSKIHAMEAKSFGVRCFRGFAPLSLLSQMSQADVYDQDSNRDGMQRGLKPKHARDAYNYAKDNMHSGRAIWPEIILNIRDVNTVKIIELSPTKGSHGEIKNVKLQLRWGVISEHKKNSSPVSIGISRVDGNHRLHFAGGEVKPKGYPPLDEVMAPFCITYNLDVALERDIFKTINETQVKLDTAHILRAEIQALPGASLWAKKPELYIANRLHTDTASPFVGRLEISAKAARGVPYLLKLKHLEYALRHLTKDNPKLRDKDTNPDTVFKAILYYFAAVKEMWPVEFDVDPQFMMMTNTGIQALGMFGGHAIRTATASAQKITREYFSGRLQKIKENEPAFWNRANPNMVGQTGRPGAARIKDVMIEFAYPKESTLDVG